MPVFLACEGGEKYFSLELNDEIRKNFEIIIFFDDKTPKNFKIIIFFNDETRNNFKILAYYINSTPKKSKKII